MEVLLSHFNDTEQEKATDKWLRSSVAGSEHQVSWWQWIGGVSLHHLSVTVTNPWHKPLNWR